MVMEVLAQSRYLSFRLKPEHTALQLRESVRLCMHRDDGMLRVNYSGTVCGHVCSGMCAAVEASPSAQTVAHLSNCLQDLNAALLLRKREAISFSPWLGVEEYRKAQGSMRWNVQWTQNWWQSCEGHCQVQNALMQLHQFLRCIICRFASLLYVLYVLLHLLLFPLFSYLFFACFLFFVSFFHPYFLLSCYFRLSHYKEFWKMCFFPMPNFLFLFISYPHISRRLSLVSPLPVRISLRAALWIFSFGVFSQQQLEQVPTVRYTQSCYKKKTSLHYMTMNNEQAFALCLNLKIAIF